MDKFDCHIKKEVKRHLQQNINVKQEEIDSINQRMKRKKSFNFTYTSAFSVLTIICFILIFPLIQHPHSKVFNSDPYFFRSGNEDKITLLLEEFFKKEEESKMEIFEEKEPENEVETQETESEREAIFLGLLEEYSKLKDYEIDYNHEDHARFGRFGESGGYRVIGFDTKAEFLAQFSHFVTSSATSKMFNLLEENENGLYLIPSEHSIIPFEANDPYQLEKINEDSYRIQQSYFDEGKEVTFFLGLEFSKINGAWLITNWDVSSSVPDQSYENEYIPEFLIILREFINIEDRFTKSDQLYDLKSGQTGNLIENIHTKDDFYSLYSDYMTKEAAEMVWGEYLVEEESNLYLLPNELSINNSPYRSNYYPFYQLHLDYTYYNDGQGGHHIEQTDYSETLNANYTLHFEFHLIDDLWYITGFSFTVE